MIIKLENIKKRYGEKEVLRDFNLEIKKGEFVGIIGKSGAGKSTLLNIIGLLEECDDGKVIIEGDQIKTKDRKKIQSLLKNKIGYLFQNYALIDDLTVYENLKIVLEGKDKEMNKKLILEALNKVELGNILDKKIYQLSGGEQQRVAIARLILKKSEIILADEPTGSLDRINGKRIMELLRELNNQGKTIIIVTHDEHVIEYCTRVINLS
ncbi:MAG TPA: ABC transporter ATP-binding protein [Candidatus Paceibacterota bacterium]|nr:ABC transporter ATP-binding protein [Candidatus Paceibacterota bacterium]